MTWHNPASHLPPEVHDVLVAVRGEERAAEAFHIAGEWTYSTGHSIDAGRVYAWAELPACPAIGGAS